MEKIVELGLLFDYYGKLLSQKQFDVVDQYYNEDLSLTEIAHNSDTTKQAVSENLKRAENKLYEYENKLGLIKRSDRASVLIKRLSDSLRKLADNALETDDRYMIMELLKDAESYMAENLEDVNQ